ncbi:MAG: hypothetical protein Q8R82_22960 [Hyphomonadaceae bacterium]|nr:hypothetical protein [Hyphomonadaceae bacterium]
MHRQSRARLLAAAIAISAIASSPATGFAQSVTGGSSGGVSGQGVSASTYGSGQQTNTPEGSSIGVAGGGDAVAVDGSASTRSDAKLNERRAMQRSVATAQDDDERARSRTRTVVREGEVRSRTVSRYKQQGEKPVREMTYSVTTPEGSTTRTK